MVLTNYKIQAGDYVGNDVASLPDKLTGTVDENKAVFDRLVKQVVALKFNQLIDALVAVADSASGADQIGATAVSGLNGETVQALIEDMAAKALAHSANTANPHGVSKAQIGLGNADNTSDLNKPVSTAQLAALNSKLDKVVPVAANSIPVFLEDGSLYDSAYFVDDFAPAQHTHNADTITDGTTNKAYTATEKAKLAGIATGATANSSDATLRNRANHTGTQAASTITGLATVATSGSYDDLSNKPSIPFASSAVTATLATASWTGSVAPYTQNVTVSGMTQTKNGLVGLGQDATAVQREAARNAMLSITQQGADSITIAADGAKPTVDIPIVVTLLG